MFLKISQYSQHLCWSLFLIKFQAFRCFPMKIAKFLRVAFFVEHLWWLLLQMFCFTLYFHSLSFVVPFVVIRCTTRYHSFSFVVTRCTTRCHSLYYSLSLIVIRCTTRYHLLSLVVIRCHSLYHSLSLVVTRYTTRLSFYKQSEINSVSKEYFF